MEQKTVAIRLSVDLYNKVTENEMKKFNASVVELIERQFKEGRIKQMDIKGIFSPQEWIAMADALNSVIIDDFARYSSEVLIAECEDAELYEGVCTAHGADVKELCAKIEKLTSIQVSSIYERIERFWNAPETDMNEWAKY